MKKRIILLSLVFVVISGLELLAIFSKPKVAFKTNGAGDSSLGVQTSKIDRELSLSFNEVKPAVALVYQAIKISDPEESKWPLDLELVGTAVGNAKDPSAFIKDIETGKQGIYKLGNLIHEAKVTKIVMGKVVLDLKGKEQILVMNSNGKNWAHLDDSDPGIISISGDQILVNRKGLASESGKIIRELKKVRISPYIESLKVAGLRVEGVNPDSILAAAGIRNSDVVTTVNSQKIDSYQKALQVLNKAKSQAEIKVSVLRDGQPQLLCYKFQ
jgi:type II secretion system protein C